MTRIRGACLLLLAPLLIAACDRTRSPARSGGTAVIAGYVDIRSMNPYTTTTDLGKALQRYALYAPLVMLDSTLTPQPWLAAAWDTTAVGADSLALTFRLRRDVVWQDGHRTSAHDVVATFARALDVRSAYVDAAALAHFSPAVQLVDSFTVRFTLRRHPDFLEAFFLLPPLPAHILGDTPAEDVARHPFGTEPVGNGPFRFVRRSAQEWVFEANPHFPQGLGGAPQLDRLVYRTVPEQTSLITEVLIGRIDLAVSIRPPQVERLLESEDVRIARFPVANWVFLALNTRLPIFAQRDVRLAISYAVDRRGLVDGIMGGYNEVGRASVTPVHWSFDRQQSAAYSPDSARMLLDRAGWLDRDGDGIRENAAGTPLRFRLKVWQGGGSYRELAEAIQAQLSRVGIAAQPEVVEFNTFLEHVQGRVTAGGRVRNFEAAIGNWTDNLLRKDDSHLLHSRFRDGPRQWTGHNSPRLDFLLDTLAVTTDRSVARPYWREYQQTLIDDAPLLVLFYAEGINAVRQRLQGVPDGDPRGTLATIARWSVR